MNLIKLFAVTVIAGMLICPLCDTLHVENGNCPDIPTTRETDHGPH